MDVTHRTPKATKLVQILQETRKKIEIDFLLQTKN
jgi:hypothetical protein